MRKAEHEEFMVEVMELLERLNCPAYLWNDVVFIASAYLLELITLKKTLLLLPPFNYSPVLKYLIIHWNIISAIREVFQGNGGFATIVRPDTLKTLVECSLYSMLDHLANDSQPRYQDCVATQLLFRFMMEMLRQNMLEAYFHNIRLTFCY